MTDQAEAALIETCGKRVKLFLSQRLQREDAEDCYQDTMLSAILAIRKGADIQCVEAYVLVIAKRKVSDRYRESINDPALDETQLPFLVSREANVEQQLIAAEREAVVSALLECLRPIEREIVNRFYLAGENVTEIREAMNLDANDFRNWKHRAIRRLSQRCSAVYSKAA